MRAVGSARQRLRVDFYHSTTEGENVGVIDWLAAFTLLRQIGYSGPIGPEYSPTGATSASIERVRELAATP
ncbi:hypothetical protein [Sphingomonas sp.]|uniref:hypothetical protein n=1 Tax=Sphingomonas sp. TaxID=28214 RepID=UPI0031D85D38